MEQKVEYIEADRAMYEFEHGLMPALLFGDKEAFINGIKTDPDRINEAFHTFMKAKRFDTEFSKETITIEFTSIEEGVECAIIKFPQPRVEPLCHEAYIVYEAKGEQISECSYFCLERGKTIVSNPFLCRWIKHKGHVNYGQIAYDRDTIIKKIKEVL